MLYIDGNTIRMTRGDTVYLTVPIANVDEEYTVQPNDMLTLSLKKTVRDTEYVLQKKITGDNTFHIEPVDTASIPFGKYKYDIQLDCEDGSVYTIIPVSTFEIMPEVTCR